MRKIEGGTETSVIGIKKEINAVFLKIKQQCTVIHDEQNSKI